ncbi:MULTISPECIES: hypothetical protein [Chryseobacterium]|uniref:Bacteriocin n=1 Tax=Chryseobacterium camelliae TaxID=1265445 RepID=A0ABU0TG86_9FLAO|nr:MULTISPECIES: hypothetical protein [Chryseobacterium]MDT3406937.1 hypothetical protein [Pseudacidovorax intermedius]MDQ1095270.1 hypothetical protein [Chryseobacterium camelliae]MDQ1099208.1 hypothetical protein [Chryseobacterium sp. SORGH_AS_1048]MDR6086558.1 hypothetical protein [Chryseobacterium sp. SORGH_AS_0909]MDR6130928.1 hypothetical protein [Chryseobacterium sp. SORGH_AS_1175]
MKNLKKLDKKELSAIKGAGPYCMEPKRICEEWETGCGCVYL